jgi:hypothetical protein
LAKNVPGRSLREEQLAGNFKNFMNHAVTLTLVSIILGALASWGISKWYYEAGKQSAIAEALEQGRKAGHAQGLKEANEANQKALPELIEKRYPGAIEQARELGEARGREQGQKEGREVGLQEGYKNGREDASKEFTQQRQAELNWQNYAAKVNDLAKWADESAANPRNQDLQAKLLSAADGLARAADELRSAYTDQASSFNSIMADLQKAVFGKDYSQMRSSARSLRDGLGIKKDLFLQGNRRVKEAFESLGK